MSDNWTISRVLAWMTDDFRQRGIDSPRLDAELLVAHSLRLDRMGLYLDLQRPLDAGELEAIRALVQRRRAREPVAYVLGERAFRKHVFRVTAAVLIPRPDTETLVEAALDALRGVETARVLDLCTGSGCVALSIASEGPTDLDVTGTDLSEDALRVAAENEARLALATPVRWRQGDLFDAVPQGERFDVITANPPYVADAEMESLAPEIREHEPALALRAGREGLDCLRRIVGESASRLTPRGRLLVEVGFRQSDAVDAMMRDAGFASRRRHRDLGGVERVVEGWGLSSD